MKNHHLVKVAAALVACLWLLPLTAAYLKDVPQELHQPDGTVIQCLADGDEFCHWLHDADGYTIICDPVTGYWVYARQAEGLLMPTETVVGKGSPAAAGLLKGVMVSKERYDSLRSARLGGSPARVNEIAAAPSEGFLNNVVIFIRFSDELEYTTGISTYEDMFNGSGPESISMKNYFWEASYSQISISSTFYPIPDGTAIVSYQDTHPRAYYRPYNEKTNPDGYRTDSQAGNREQQLIKAAVTAVGPQVPPELNIDVNNDGKVDNVCFVVSGNPEGWSELLWPHMWSLYQTQAFINGKKVATYDFQLAGDLRNGGTATLCHEMFHSLGSPDLYHYSYDGMTPVYTWDVMEYTTYPPQHMGAYMKYRYGHWISSIPEIATPGTYTLNPITSSTGNCFKVASPNSSTEFFIIEYRRKGGIFEKGIPGSGLLVYRIDTKRDGYGNAGGPPDEVWLYRPGGAVDSNGNPSQANLSSDACRAGMNDGTRTAPFLSDGEPGGLQIGNVGTAGDTISFDLGSLQTCMMTCSASVSTSSGTAPLTVKFNALSRTCDCTESPVYHWDFGDGQSSDKDYPEHAYTAAGTYTWTFTASADGFVCTSTGAVTVSMNCQISCEASALPVAGEAPLAVSFHASSTATDCTEAPVYTWNFGDGGTSFDQNPSHTYSAAGEHQWQLTVTTGGVTCTRTGSVKVCGLTCEASSSLASGLSPLTVAFTSTAAAEGCTQAASYSWKFGDGGTSADQNPSHTYAAGGEYVWQFTAVAGGSTCSKSGTVNVCGMTCDASVQAVGWTGKPAKFSASAQLSGCGGEESYAWDFGDGGTGTGKSAEHAYAGPGPYSWKVVVSWQGGTCEKGGTITVAAPGDCDGSGQVSISEFQKAVNMFLGLQAPDCGVDCNGDGSVSIGEVQKVASAYLGLPTSC